MTDTTIDDGGPAFPVAEDHKVASDILWTQGMSLRAYAAVRFAAAWAGALGVGEMLETREHRAEEAVRLGVIQADVLLRELAAPKEPTPPEPITYDPYAASSAEKDALKSLLTRTWFEDLPERIRDYVTVAGRAIDRAARDEDDIPF
jgi:hypothetical protein